jgi:diaminopimelate epimerase
MLLNQHEGYDFEMKYYNADGNESTMCGNGGRCLVKFASDMGIIKSQYKFIAADGVHIAEIKDQIVWLKMNDVDRVDTRVTDFILNSGSPHYVKMIPSLESINVFEEGRKIRYDSEFKKEGINVNFVEDIGKNSIFVRTYERGVENETLSCGTGVTASALVSAKGNNGLNRIDVKTLGGNLVVEFEKINSNQFKNIWLCGPASFVFKGEVEI